MAIFDKKAQGMTIPSKQKKAEGCVLFIHGLGDSCLGWADFVTRIVKKYPNLMGVLPNAPNQPTTLNNGYKMRSWHDIEDLQNIDQEDFKGLDESREIIEGILDRIVKSGIPSNKIILAGFSQGAALAAFAGLQSKKTLAGIVCMSGYLTHKDSDEFIQCIDEANKKTPVLILHGTDDNVVNPKCAKRLYQTIKKAKVPVEIKHYQGVQHHSCPQSEKDVLTFLGKVAQ